MTSSLLTRRKFLGVSAAIAGAASSGLLATEDTAPKRKIPIGFLGATHSHAVGKLGVVMASKDYELVGVCETSETVGKECEKLGAKIISQAELLERSEIVAVESAVRDHAKHALLALKAGKHVHLEKPPSVTFQEMEEIVALARTKKLLLQTGYMWRYHPGFITIFKAVREGRLGDIFMVRANISSLVAPARRPEWAEFKGGGMFELGSHLVDATVRLLGKPKAVTPFLRQHGKFSDDLKDNNVAILEYEKALAVITNTALQDSKLAQRSFEVLGSNGSAMLRPIEPPTLEMELLSAPSPKGVQTVPMPGYKRYESDFVELAAAARGECQLSVSLDEELMVHETLLRISQMI